MRQCRNGPHSGSYLNHRTIAQCVNVFGIEERDLAIRLGIATVDTADAAGRGKLE